MVKRWVVRRSEPDKAEPPRMKDECSCSRYRETIGQEIQNLFGSGRYEGTRTLRKSSTNGLEAEFAQAEFSDRHSPLLDPHAVEEHSCNGCGLASRCLAYDENSTSSSAKRVPRQQATGTQEDFEMQCE
jgi:hypothetical protein